MKRLTLATLTIALMTTGVAFADPVLGVWKTKPDDNGHYGHIQISKCGEMICGFIGKAYDASGKQIESEHVGKRMIWQMRSDGGGSYSGGKIWAPDRDKTYTSYMTLTGDNLKVEGCVFGICRGQTWTRIR
ncbi:DUF2147 domain-containing protein [Pseudaestuariivita rosea]|uniref:DUF2147 domain-containing protein n=1 Tax=Pseudaestuariivita rosea TaxID=2763263 RepID=UPI001ABB128C|nr:DUF2147 domain-containing protein [Pseudaestuariivita rosea]